jgi:hypothetical protein
MAGAGVGKRVEVGDEDRLELEPIVRASSSEVRMGERARIVLCAAEGLRRDLQPDRQALHVDLHRQGPRGISARISRMNH